MSNLKINLDELDRSQLEQLSKFLIGIGKNSHSIKVEYYITQHFKKNKS